jgi:hypothetical protein
MVLATASAWVRSAETGHLKVQLVSDGDSVQPGKPLRVGLRFELEQPWHIYWRNPGDSGEPPRVRWRLPAGFQAGELQWPAPERLGSGTVIDYGYQGSVLLPVAIRTLSGYAGKYVVLEWHNNGCPFVRKHYGSRNMQQLQKRWTARGVVWLTVISSAPGQQGYVTGAEENAYLKQMDAAPTAALLDPAGTLGHLYDAKTSPHMFVIDPSGTLIYNGAIDDQPTTDPAGVAEATNYVSQALTEAMAGKPVSLPTSRPYGCSVKYAD